MVSLAQKYLKPEKGARLWGDRGLDPGENEQEEADDNDDLYAYVAQNKRKPYAHQPAPSTTQQMQPPKPRIGSMKHMLKKGPS